MTEQQWRPPSDPPSTARQVLCRRTDHRCTTPEYYVDRLAPVPARSGYGSDLDRNGLLDELNPNDWKPLREWGQTQPPDAWRDIEPHSNEPEPPPDCVMCGAARQWEPSEDPYAVRHLPVTGAHTVARLYLDSRVNRRICEACAERLCTAFRRCNGAP